MLNRWLKNRRWRLVGTVVGKTTFIDDNDAPTGEKMFVFFHLEERADGRRRYTKSGGYVSSAASQLVEAEVIAWSKGGPLPSGLREEEEPPSAELIVLDGGKK